MVSMRLPASSNSCDSFFVYNNSLDMFINLLVFVWVELLVPYTYSSVVETYDLVPCINNYSTNRPGFHPLRFCSNSFNSCCSSIHYIVISHRCV